MEKQADIMDLLESTVDALTKLMDSVDGCYQFVPSDCGQSEYEQVKEAVAIWNNAEVVLEQVKNWKEGKVN